MKGLVSVFCAVALPLAGMVAFSAPASAAPPAPRTILSEDVGLSEGAGIHDVRNHRQNRGQNRGRWERRGGNAYYNNHRGYRQYRRGYRQHNGYWFPPAAFVAGAIIGGAIAAPPPARGGNAHVRWCASQYRSYRPYDNTFQPYNGPRRQCRSPYM